MMSETQCPKCQKTSQLCVCEQIQPLPTRLHVLILQHPQEPDKELGSARITNLTLENSTLRVGLSWSNLSKALGRTAQNPNWGVLFLGGRKPTSKTAEPLTINKGGRTFLPNEVELEGIVVLDGTWSQAKTLWWRNPWLLKLKRLILNPRHRSLYQELRREPRRECLSTLEAIAETLDAFGEDAEAGVALRKHFSELLKKYRKLHEARQTTQTSRRL